MARQTVDDWNQVDEGDGRRALPAWRAKPEPDADDRWTLKTQRRRRCRTSSCSRRTSCSLANVQAFVTANPDVRKHGRGARHGPRAGLRQPHPAESAQGLHGARGRHRERPDGDTNQPKFTWQRNGDLRYSFLHWVDRPQAAGPLGYGPSSQDPETGEIVSASAYIYGAALDIYAKFATDSVRLANGQLSTDDLLSGKTISDVLAESAAASKKHAADSMTDAAKNLIQARLKALGPTRDDRLRQGRGGHRRSAAAAAQGNDGGEAAAERRRAAGDHPPATGRATRCRPTCSTRR